MTFPNLSIDNVLKILLALSQYPILSSRIRHQMRKALFARGVITRQAFDEEARLKAIESQEREGLHDPYVEEHKSSIALLARWSYKIVKNHEKP